MPPAPCRLEMAAVLTLRRHQAAQVTMMTCCWAVEKVWLAEASDESTPAAGPLLALRLAWRPLASIPDLHRIYHQIWWTLTWIHRQCVAWPSGQCSLSAEERNHNRLASSVHLRSPSFQHLTLRPQMLCLTRLREGCLVVERAWKVAGHGRWSASLVDVATRQLSCL